MKSSNKVLWINITILSLYTLIHYLGPHFSTESYDVISPLIYWWGFWVSVFFMGVQICLNLMISAVLFFQKDGKLASPFLLSVPMIAIAGFIANYVVFVYHLSAL